MTDKPMLGGMFGNVALLDIASMHPHSIIAMNMFGPYTKRYKDILDTRIAIKHGDFETAEKLLDNKFTDAELRENQKILSTALKIPINSVYGLTSAHFPTRFNDVASGPRDRNKDNKVAKRGALFMITLKHKVQEMGYTVVHIKTDSIKIADADDYIINWVTDFGHKYGYTFEHEATYDKLCIVNKSTYIAHSAWGEHAGEWTATGLQFQVPYVFKTLFSGEPINLSDLSETKSVQTSLYLDFNEDLPADEHNYSFVGKVGAFIPVKSGSGGGELVRSDGKGGYSSATGAKGYRWKESSIIRDRNLNNEIDMSYYEKLADDAIEAINERGDYGWFVSDEPYISPNPESNKTMERLFNAVR